MSLLEIKGLRVHYGKALILDGVDLKVDQGELIGVIGPNGAGKTTLLRAISNVAPVEGAIIFQDQPIDALSPERIVSLGVIHCPEGRHLFPDLSVLENIEIGAYLRKDKAGVKEDIDRVFSLFPVLRERSNQAGGTLSGGEQQMLAIGRALMARPKLLLLDEPSLGLAPILVDAIFEIIRQINNQGTTILLVEQNAQLALQYSHRGYVIETGEIALTDTSAALLKNEQVKKAYLGD